MRRGYPSALSISSKAADRECPIRLKEECCGIL